MRLLPRTPRGTWLLAGAVWLAGCGGLWWLLPYRPRAAWQMERQSLVHGFIPRTSVLLTSSMGSPPNQGPDAAMSGPLMARDATTGRVREWLPDGERLTLVDPGVDGRRVLIGRFVGGRARLFLHDASGGAAIAELPRDGLVADEPENGPSSPYEQFAAFRHDGRQVAYADDVADRRRLRVWDVETKKEVALLPDAGPPVVWSPDGQSLAYCTRMGDVWSLRLWDPAAGHSRALVAALPANREPTDLAFSPKGQKIAAAIRYLSEEQPTTLRMQVVGWDVTTGLEAYRIADPGTMVPLEATSFITCEFPEAFEVAIVRRRDYDAGTEIGRFTLAAGLFKGWYARSPKAGLYFALARHENTIMEMLGQRVLGWPPGEFVSCRPVLFDSETGQERHRLPMALDMHFNGWSCSQWSSDGTLLTIAGNDRVAVWDIPPRRSLSWFVAGAVLLAVPPFLIARRRAQRLRRETAA